MTSGGIPLAPHVRGVRERLGRPPGRRVLAGLSRRRGSAHPLPARRRPRQPRAGLSPRLRRSRRGIRAQYGGPRRTLLDVVDRHARPRIHRQAGSPPGSQALPRSPDGLSRRHRRRARAPQRRVARRLGGGPRRRRPPGSDRPAGTQHRGRLAGRSRGDETDHHACRWPPPRTRHGRPCRPASSG